MINSKNTDSKNNSQSGIVAIMVTVMMMLVITLIVLTFSKIIRREQRQALDRQLNTQAFYAAESGVNDAIKALKANPSIKKEKCNDATEGGTEVAALVNNSVIDADHDVSYSCLTINPGELSELIYELDTHQSISVPVKSSNNSDLSKIFVEWNTDVGNINCNALMNPDNNFPKFGDTGSSCETAVLRVDIVPAKSLDRASLVTNARTVFLIPDSTSSGVAGFNYTTADKSGEKYGISCSANKCNASIDVTSILSPQYYLHIRSIYFKSKVKITATGGGAPVKLKGAQALIDSTGKANDVLRRIQVRIPLSESGKVPGFAIQSTDTICKRLKVTGAVVEFDPTDLPGSVNDADNLPDQKPCLIADTP